MPEAGALGGAGNHSINATVAKVNVLAQAITRAVPTVAASKNSQMPGGANRWRAGLKPPGRLIAE